MSLRPADMDDAPFADLPDVRVPYRLTRRGLGYSVVRESWDVLADLQRELDEFLAERDSR